MCVYVHARVYIYTCINIHTHILYILHIYMHTHTHTDQYLFKKMLCPLEFPSFKPREGMWYHF